MEKHKNNNDAVGNYAVYQIMVRDKIYKIGKADIDRITKSSGDPTRIHQQVTELRKKYTRRGVFHIVVETMFGVTTQYAKEVEEAILELVTQQMGYVPEGNQKSYKPKK